MVLTNLLIENIFKSQLFQNNFMKGGNFNSQHNYDSTKTFYILIGMIIILLIKGLIIFILYNNFLPKILYNFSNKSLEDIESNFRNISFFEAILLVIFTNTLFTSC